jgi:hypothetical protein
MAGKIFGGIYAEMRPSIEVQVTPFFGVRPQYFQAI